VYTTEPPVTIAADFILCPKRVLPIRPNNHAICNNEFVVLYQVQMFQARLFPRNPHDVPFHIKLLCISAIDTLLVKIWAGPLEHDLVDVTPAPVFAGLEGLDNRVVGRVEMPGRMLVFRRVAAADVSTNEALAQMHPGVANFQTILAAVCAGGDISYLVKMSTRLCHLLLPSLSRDSSLIIKQAWLVQTCLIHAHVEAYFSMKTKTEQTGSPSRPVKREEKTEHLT
jgi:hypothetical protein